MSEKLPTSWAWAELQDITEISPKFDANDLHDTELVHFVPMAAVAENFGGADVSQLRPLNEVRKGYTFFAEGDVLFAKITPCMENGKGALVPHLARNHAFGSTEFHVLRPSTSISGKWLAHFVSQPHFRKMARHNMTGTAGQLRVPTKWLQSVRMPIPPWEEQTRIVAKLEELLSDLDAGVAELKAAQKKLQQYRQSMFKAAVEGALTASWRKTQRASNTPLETGAELLERILRERRAGWEEKQLAKFKEQGKAPPKNWQQKYPEPVAPDTIGLPALPEGWVWATLSQVGWLDRGRSKHRPRNAPHLYGGAYPFVQTGDIRHSDTFISEVETTYSEAGLAQSRLWPVGTMCITIAANIGKTAILAMEACFPDSVVGFLTAIDDVSVRYVEYFMRSVQQKLEDEAPATAQKNINLEILEKVIIPLPPALEQYQIVEILDDALAAATENCRSIEKSLKLSTAQRQNILRAAFAGQLVPQVPDDEPAIVLLERIRSERDGQAATRKPRGRKTTEAAI